jgi:hypothetical protein
MRRRIFRCERGGEEEEEDTYLGNGEEDTEI